QLTTAVGGQFMNLIYKGKILSALKKHESVLIKYSGHHSLSANSIAKLVRHSPMSCHNSAR
ncbi:MAG: hypothetical protein J6328_00020, partial [Bacilli bacterium]|nr:hypothetical protein [Bacilli bacterium]